MKPFKIAILGPSGSGKGTQAQLLAKKYGWQHLSVGQLFRDEIAKNSPLGKKVEKFVSQGLWVPTDLTLAVLTPVLKSFFSRGFIIDGFPRVPDQPEALDKLLSENNTNLDLVIHIDIRPEVIDARRKKAWSRGKSFYQKARKDETDKVIKRRIESYQKTITPILNYYDKKGILVKVNGERPVKAINREIVAFLEKALREKENE